MTKNKQKMLAEIKEQNLIFEKLIKKYIQGNKVLFPELREYSKYLKQVKRVLILGCGSSRHAGLLAEYYFEEIAEVNCEVEFANEYRLKNIGVEESTLVIAITQSGSTKDTIEALKKAEGKNILKISVVNNPDPKIKKYSDVVLDVDAGKEVSLAATKSFTAQVFVLLLLSFYVSKTKGTSLKEIKKAHVRIASVLAMEGEAKKLANKLRKYEDCVLLGRKYTTPIAFEEALKMKETSYIHAEGFPMGEFLHGPMAIIDKEIPLIAIIPDDKYLSKNVAILKILHAREGIMISIVSKKDKLISSMSDFVVEIPKTNNFLYPILVIVFLQMFAYYLAKNKNINPKDSRGLKKAITTD